MKCWRAAFGAFFFLSFRDPLCVGGGGDLNPWPAEVSIIFAFLYGNYFNISHSHIFAYSCRIFYFYFLRGIGCLPLACEDIFFLGRVFFCPPPPFFCVKYRVALLWVRIIVMSSFHFFLGALTFFYILIRKGDFNLIICLEYIPWRECSVFNISRYWWDMTARMTLKSNILKMAMTVLTDFRTTRRISRIFVLFDK